MGITRSLLLLLLLSLFVVTPVTAKIRANTATLHNAAVAVADGPALPVDTYNTVVFEVTIGTTATVTFESSGVGSGWVNQVCISVSDIARTKVISATASGVFQCNVAGMQATRARISAYTSGPVTVLARMTTALFGGN